jgi:hypothetical protein
MLDSLRLAEEMVAYYERFADELACEPWIAGMQAAQEWRRLITSDSVSQQEVFDLLTTAKSNQFNGTGWCFMARWVYDWARGAGHDVPPREEFFFPREEYFADQLHQSVSRERPWFRRALRGIHTWLTKFRFWPPA